ncbi:N-acetylmannosamine-6-phosphate 2-epimerase [Paenibacillus lautus]|uniref:N-acetylmannosamine-6-phosphate 2-epimerase n=1 Tax=Paenibacillus TaxID=44249 RepID=UPI002DBC1773|nr:N-acetylmannosamine-6-phosphate 2-epimerase [Paenibacillus lautus]MEC0254760.1 N-acetylmannosamine-6-phosphate 2-epimerase [Paenibacillus lautus]MEC0309163.1 N-acetylmannosamine-6-phosphate 2-epimerase [Paenibacillus lautus]
MKRGLIVSCQALPGEPLHSSFIMGRMAIAAAESGAVGIRANSVEDIEEIKKQVELPIIGIIKKDYPGMQSFITATMTEVDALVGTGVEIIAVQATMDQDEAFLQSIFTKYPSQKFMADISTTEEGLRAERLGFHYIGTTLIGYTPQSQHVEKFTVLEELIKQCKKPVIAEGNFNTPEQAAKAIEMGAYCVVVGSAITRPQIIAKWFSNAVNEIL